MDSDLLKHVERFGVTTADVVRRLFFAGHAGRALSALGKLVERRTLCCRSGYYARHAGALQPRPLRTAYAVLWYCCVRQPHSDVLPPERVEKLTAFASELGFSPARNALCHVDRTRKRLCLIRSLVAGPEGRPLGVEQILIRLQRFVVQPAFKPWVYFAKNGGFQLIVLVNGEEVASELTRWLRRRPLYSSLLDPPAAVPARIVAVPVPALPKR